MAAIETPRTVRKKKQKKQAKKNNDHPPERVREAGSQTGKLMAAQNNGSKRADETRELTKLISEAEERLERFEREELILHIRLADEAS